jgi:hypothetical protein
MTGDTGAPSVTISTGVRLVVPTARSKQQHAALASAEAT